jgi:hypothetical protein
MDNADRNPVGALQVGPFKGSDHCRPVKNEGGREAGKCTKMVPDRANRCLFTFLSSRCLSFNVFLFPVSCKDQLIGN